MSAYDVLDAVIVLAVWVSAGFIFGVVWGRICRERDS